MADLPKALQKEDTQATKVSDDNNTEKCALSSQLPMNNVSSHSQPVIVVPFQTQSGLLATTVPHSIPAKPRKVCTLSPSLMTVNVVVRVCILHLHLCDVMMS